MSPWQLLRANRSSRAALGYHLQHGAGAAGTVHYSTAPAPPAEDCMDNGGWSSSSEKQTMQQLNVRLASYLQQVALLEETNQRLEHEIQEELRKRCPVEVKELDGLLKSASFLQDQIRDCLSARAQLNLRLLAAELAIVDLSTRCEQEREQRGRVEADLSDLRYLHEVLNIHKLPELQGVLSEQRQELQELQRRHLQDGQALLNQASGGVDVAMQTVQSSDLIQQLDMLRQLCTTESWTEVPVLEAPDVTCDLAVSSEVAELEHLMRTSTDLTEDLKHLQRETAALEASGRQQNENIAVQLTVLQETADHLCLDLDAVLHATVQQAADHQVLLDEKSRLETEIQDYNRLLDLLSHQGASGIHLNAKPADSCFMFRHGNVNTSEAVRGGSMRANMVQMISSPADHNNRPKKSAIISSNSSNQIHSFQTSLSRTGWESNSHKNLTRVQNSSPVQSQAKESYKQANDRASEPQSSFSIVSNAKPSQTFAPPSKPQNPTHTKFPVEQIISDDEPKVMQRHDFGTHKLTNDTVKPSAADLKKEAESSASTESVSHANKINPPQNAPQDPETPQQMVVDEVKLLPESVKVSESEVCESTVEIKVSDGLDVLNDKDPGTQESNDQEGIEIGDTVSSTQSLAVTNVSQSEPNRTDSVLESIDYAGSQAESVDSLKPDVVREEVIDESREEKVASETNTESALQVDFKTSPIGMDSSFSLQNKDIKEVVSAESVQTSMMDSATSSSISLSQRMEELKDVMSPESVQTSVTESVAEVNDGSREVKVDPPETNTESAVQEELKASAIGIDSDLSSSIPQALQNEDITEVQKVSPESDQTPVMDSGLSSSTPQAVKNEDLKDLVSEVNVGPPETNTESTVPEDFETSTVGIDSDSSSSIPQTLQNEDRKEVQKVSTESDQTPVMDSGLSSSTPQAVKNEDLKDVVSEVNVGPPEMNTESTVPQDFETSTVGIDSDSSSSIPQTLQNEDRKEVQKVNTESDQTPVMDSDSSSSIPQTLQSEDIKDVVSPQSVQKSVMEEVINKSAEVNVDPPQTNTESAVPEASEMSNVGIDSDSSSSNPQTLQSEDIKDVVSPESVQTPVMDSDSSSSIPQTLQNEDLTAVVSSESVQTCDQSFVGSDVSASEQNKLAQDEVTSSDVVIDYSPGREDPVLSETAGEENLKVEKDEEEVSQECDVKETPEEEDNETIDPSGQTVLINTKDSEMTSTTSDFEVDLSPEEGVTLTEAENEHVERQEEQMGSDLFVDQLGPVLCDKSSSEPVKLTENDNTPLGSDGKENQSAGPESVNVKVDVVEELLTDSKDGVKDLAESDNEPSESNRLISSSDSGVALSFSSKEDNLSLEEPVVSHNQAVSLDMSSSDALLMMSLDDPTLFPMDLDENVMSPDRLQSPSDMETCLSPEEPLQIDEEDDDDVCLSLTEANVHVRPVEKYILSTKDENKLLPERGESTNTAEEDKCKVFEGNEDSKGNLNVIESPVIQEGSSGRGLESGGSNIKSIIADKEKQLGFVGLYRKPVRTAQGPSEEHRRKSDIANRINVPPGRTFTSGPGNVTAGRVRKGSEEWITGGSPRQTNEKSSGGSPLSTSQPKRGRFGSGEWIVYGGDPQHKSSLDGAGTLPNEGNDANISKLGTSAPETGRFGWRGSGGSEDWMGYGGSIGKNNGGLTRTDNIEHRRTMSPPESGRFGRRSSGGSDEWTVYGGSVGQKANEGVNKTGSKELRRTMSPPESGRFGRRSSGGSDDYLVYGGSLGHQGNEGLNQTGIKEHMRPMSPPESGRFGRRSSGGSDDYLVYGGSFGHQGNEGLNKTGIKEHMRPMSPPESGRFARRASGDWIVYGGTGGRSAGSESPRRPDGTEHPTAAMQLPLSPPGSVRFGSGSGEWRVYGGSGRLSRPASSEQRVISPPGSYTGRGPSFSHAGSRLTSGGVMKRSSSVGSGGRLSSQAGNQRISSTGSVDTKPVYSTAAGHRSSSAGAGRPAGGSQRAQSPAGNLSVTGKSGGWLHSSMAGGNRTSSNGSGSRGSTGGSSNDRISGASAGRISGSSGSGRVKSTGGRVITSSDRPIRSTGSGSGSNKERISVCKMAALLLSAAGRERSKEKQKKKQQQQQQATAASPLVQRWLTSGVGADPENPDDIMGL